MKNIYAKPLSLLVAIFISMGFILSDEKGKIHLKVSKEENGEQTVFEKVYSNMDELKADDELKRFDVLIDRWANENDHETIHISHGDHDDNKKIIIKHLQEDGENTNIREEKIIRIETKDGEQNFTFNMDGDGDHKMVWIDEDGNKTDLTDADIEKMVQEHEDGNIEGITSEDEESEPNIVFMGGDVDHTAEIEIEIKKEIGLDGEEKIVEKNVWVTKDGKKTEVDEESDFRLEDDGDQVIVIAGKSDSKEGVKQTMDVNIEEKNGEKFIEIDIKRTNDLNVHISEIMENDESLNDVDYSIKNNLKPAQLNYYPNPNNGRFNLDFILDSKKEVTIKVLDILGNEVYKETLLDFDGNYHNEIDLTGKEKGVYILQVRQKKKTLARKILIE